jgi:flagellar protein FlbD
VIQLTRLNHGSPFYVNPDLVERVDTHVDTVVRLTSGSELVVKETAEEIVQRIAEFRARVIALSALFADAARADATRADAALATAPIGDTDFPAAELSDGATDVPPRGAPSSGAAGSPDTGQPAEGVSPWAPAPATEIGVEGPTVPGATPS